MPELLEAGWFAPALEDDEGLLFGEDMPLLPDVDAAEPFVPDDDVEPLLPMLELLEDDGLLLD